MGPRWRMYLSVNLAIIGSDNGLLPVWQQAIIWTKVANFNVSIGNHNHSNLYQNKKIFMKKVHLKSLPNDGHFLPNDGHFVPESMWLRATKREQNGTENQNLARLADLGLLCTSSPDSPVF